MKNIFLTALLLGLGLVLQAQEQQSQSIIYLNDGSQIKGYISDKQSLDLLGIRLSDGTEIQVSRKLVKSIVERQNNLKFFQNGKFVKTSGTYAIIFTGIAPAWGEDEEYIQWGGNALHGVVGHQFNQYVSVGGGLGLDVYSNSFIPFYADFRGYILQRKISPYYAFQAGYSLSNDLFNNISNNVNFKGGLMIHPTLGLRFASFKHTKFLLEAGYKFQWGTRTYDWNENIDRIVFRRLTFKIGWLF